MKKILISSSLLLVGAAPILSVVSCGNKSTSNGGTDTSNGGGSSENIEQKIQIQKKISYEGFANLESMQNQEVIIKASFILKAQEELMNDPKIVDFFNKNSNKKISMEINYTCQSGLFETLEVIMGKFLGTPMPSSTSIKTGDKGQVKTTKETLQHDLQPYLNLYSSSVTSVVEFTFIAIAE